ncbi:MAG: hypothetical protein KAT05_12285, partial [Spirochaetes bacterium]|nr:hypothetical protein [Spirochaetota bacterium]
KIKSILNEYIKSFNSENVKKINFTYNQITDLSGILNFDWFYFIHKFDSEITEANFNYKPNFDSVEGKYILDELIAINDSIETIDFNKDWKNIYEYIKAVSDDAALVNILKKIIQYSKIIKRDDYLLKIIRLIYKNPFFESQKFSSNAKVVQDYIYSFQLEVKKAVDRSIKELKRAKIEDLLLDIFHKTAIVRLKHYTQRINDLLLKKGVLGIRYIDPLNYLKAFLLDFCKGEVKSRIDFLLIKGTWSTNSYSSEYSSLLVHFNKLSDMVIDFDNRCSDEERYGKSIRKLIFAVSHDPGARNLLKKVIYKIDAEAGQLIFDSIKIFNIAASKLKALIDDYNLKTPEIIIDFHKMRWEFPSDVIVDLSELTKKLNSFVALLKYFTKGTKETKIEK